MSNFDLLDLAATLAGIALFGWLGAIISSRKLLTLPQALERFRAKLD